MMRNTQSILAMLISITLLGCGTGDSALSDDIVDLSVTRQPLPAGITHQPYVYSSALCFQCPQPTHAVTTTPMSADAATRLLAQADLGDRVPAGYPFAAHTDELGDASAGEGVVLVLAQFADGDVANSWLDILSSNLSVPIRVSTLSAVLPYSEDGRVDHHLAVQVGGSEPVVAYRRDEVDAHWGQRGIPAVWDQLDLEPACTVAAGSVFVGEFHALYDWGRVVAPVNCDGVPAYVPFTATRLETVVLPYETAAAQVHEDDPLRWRIDEEAQNAPDNAFFLFQITSVECDSALVDVWPFVDRVRTSCISDDHPVARGGPC